MSRPATYLGTLEDRACEMQAVGQELVVEDVDEFADLRDLNATLARIAELAIENDVRFAIERARAIASRRLRRDLQENRAHRLIAVGAR